MSCSPFAFVSFALFGIVFGIVRAYSSSVRIYMRPTKANSSMRPPHYDTIVQSHLHIIHESFTRCALSDGRTTTEHIVVTSGFRMRWMIFELLETYADLIHPIQCAAFGSVRTQRNLQAEHEHDVGDTGGRFRIDPQHERQ